MGSWYWIGVCVGLGVAIGVLLAGLLAGTRAALVAGLVLAVGAGVAVGFALGQWDEAVGGGVGGALGAIGSAQLVVGNAAPGRLALRHRGVRRARSGCARGARLDPDRRLPGGGSRSRFRRAPARPRAERYAGLRSLAKD